MATTTGWRRRSVSSRVSSTWPATSPCGSSAADQAAISKDCPTEAAACLSSNRAPSFGRRPRPRAMEPEETTITSRPSARSAARSAAAAVSQSRVGRRVAGSISRDEPILTTTRRAPRRAEAASRRRGRAAAWDMTLFLTRAFRLVSCRIAPQCRRMMESLFPASGGLSPILAGTLGSLAAGMMTAVGAVPLLFFRKAGVQTQSALLGFAAGVMLAASFFSLIIPGVDVLQAGGAGQAMAAGVMATAVLIGAAVIGLMNRFAPVDMLAIGPAGSRDLSRRIWLFIIAITLHNFPEGAAVGVSFGGGDMQQGLSTAVGIGIQNMPEGLAVSAAMATLGYGRWPAFLAALASGLVEPVGGLIGASVVGLVPGALPWGLGLAAGAMIYVVTAEIIPETREKSKGEGSMIGLMIGLVGMMFLDIALG